MPVRYTYVNGKILPHAKAVIPVDDIGLTRAFGVYDGIMTYGGKPFELARHYRRLSRSAKLLGLRAPVDEKELGRIILTLVAKNSFKNPIVRVILTGGTTIHGIDFNPKNPTLIVLLEELGALPKDAYTTGVRVITHEYQRYIPEAKTIHYIAAVRLQPAMRKAKAVEALYTWKGKVLEATTSNLFIVKRKGKEAKIIGPNEGILNGITRQVTVECARRAYAVEEREVTVKELLAADEVFLASSFKEILPVSHIDGKVIGNQGGKPGPVTKDMIKRFKEYVEKSMAK